MSGHSKWSTIKRKKGIKDTKRGAIFTKLARDIVLAVQEAGPDIDMNFSLRLAVQKAKEANMPNENIDRAIKKGAGEGEKSTIQSVSYEAHFPNGLEIIIDCQTDNNNRTVAEIRKVVEQHGGKFLPPGSLAWQFDEKGVIEVKPFSIKKSEKFGAADEKIPVDKEELMLTIMEIDGVVDIEEDDEMLVIITDKNLFANVKKNIQGRFLDVNSAELVKLAKEEKAFSEEEAEKNANTIEAIEDMDDVTSVWSNAA